MDAYIKRWKFVRSETINILKSLNDNQLLFKPEGDKWQALYYQFGCVARTQVIYTSAILNGKMDFSLFASTQIPGKNDFKTTEELLTYLKACDKNWLDALAKTSSDIAWPDGTKPLGVHIMALAEHERIHHGQLVSYFTLAGFELPSSFKSNWAL